MPDNPAALEEVQRDLRVLLADPRRVDDILDRIEAARDRDAAVDVVFEAGAALRALRVLGLLLGRWSADGDVLRDADPFSEAERLVVEKWLGRITRKQLVREAFAHVFPYSFGRASTLSKRNDLRALLAEFNMHELRLIADDMGLLFYLPTQVPNIEFGARLVEAADRQGRLDELLDLVVKWHPRLRERITRLRDHAPGTQAGSSPKRSLWGDLQRLLVLGLVSALGASLAVHWRNSTRLIAASAQTADAQQALRDARSERDLARVERDRALRALQACVCATPDGAVASPDASMTDGALRPPVLDRP